MMTNDSGLSRYDRTILWKLWAKVNRSQQSEIDIELIFLQSGLFHWLEASRLEYNNSVSFWQKNRFSGF